MAEDASAPLGLLDPPDFQEEAESLHEEYLAQEGKKIPRAQVLPPREATDPVIDATNILFGDLGRAAGLSLDRKGLHWAFETAKDAWTETPVQSAIEVGTALAPVAFAALKYSRAGKIASVGDDALRALNLVDEGVDIANLSEGVKDILRNQAYSMQRATNLREKIELGTATKGEQTLHWLEKKFGNSYMEAADPAAGAEKVRDWAHRFKSEFLENEKIVNLSKNAPPDELGPTIARYYNDPKHLTEVPEKYRPWVMAMADEQRGVQSQALKEGLLDMEEVENVGDVWFPLLREDTPGADAGLRTTVVSRTKDGKMRLASVPKTYSPSLLNRKMSRQELGDFVNRQEAATLLTKGDSEGALRLLKEERYADARGLVTGGDSFGAVKLLTHDGKVNLKTEAITIGALAQQKAMLEVYRSVRDVAMRYGKKGTEITPQMKEGWESLDGLFGANRLRRMVGIAKGMDGSVDELGWVPKKLFEEVASITGHSKEKGSVLDLVPLLTAMHKTMKTAANPATHLQNVIGNVAFLWNAGENVASPEFWKTQRTAWNALRDMGQRFKETGSIEELAGLGSLPSKLGKGSIDLADELNSNEVKNLIEMSDMLSAEGMGTIGKMAAAAPEGSVTKWLAGAFAKGSKATGLDKMAKWYMAEDGAMKFGYYLSLRQRGLSRKAASLEVSRRMPMYNTIGDAWKTARRSIQPWISFPVEVSRIMKNNMMDHPLRTSMLMQMPNFVQLGSYAAMQAPEPVRDALGSVGLNLSGPQSYSTIQARQKQLPMWAQRPSSTMLPWLDKNGDFRHATMDFLPYSAIFPESISPDAPALQQTPIFRKPFPILEGLLYAVNGKDAWGNDVPANTTIDKAKTAAIQTMAFLAPPLVDKYVLNPADPAMFYRLHQDLGRYPNMFTDKTGDPLFDFFANSIVGARSYPSSAEQAVANDNFRKRDLDSYKARLSKEASALLKIGDTEGTGEKLTEVYQILLEQYGQPDVARRKFNDFIKRFRSRNKSAKVLQGMSIEQLDREMDLAGDSLANESAAVRAEHIAMLKAERGKRGRRSENGQFNPLIPGISMLPAGLE